jgi:hypothetical protein
MIRLFGWARLVLLLLVISLSNAKEEKSEKEKEIGTVIGIDLGTTYSW